MATCPQGHEVSDGKPFCQDCGAEVAAEPSKPPAPAKARLSVPGPMWFLPAIALIAVCLIVILIVVSLNHSSGKSLLVEVDDTQARTYGHDCTNLMSEFAGLENGHVTLRDSDGKTLGLEQIITSSGTSDGGEGCVFNVKFDGVKKAIAYKITVTGQDGSESSTTLSYEQVVSYDWDVNVSKNF